MQTWITLWLQISSFSVLKILRRFNKCFIPHTSRTDTHLRQGSGFFLGSFWAPFVMVQYMATLRYQGSSPLLLEFFTPSYVQIHTLSVWWGDWTLNIFLITLTWLSPGMKNTDESKPVLIEAGKSEGKRWSQTTCHGKAG